MSIGEQLLTRLVLCDREQLEAWHTLGCGDDLDLDEHDEKHERYETARRNRADAWPRALEAIDGTDDDQPHCAYSGLTFTECKTSDLCDCFAATPEQQGAPDEIHLAPEQFRVAPPESTP